MTVLDDKLVPKALELINKFGLSATYTTERRTYDPATRKSVLVTVEYTVKVTPPFGYDERLIVTEIIRADDSFILIAGSGLAFTPAMGDFILIKTVKWRVARSQPLYSGEQVAAYQLQLRSP